MPGSPAPATPGSGEAGREPVLGTEHEAVTAVELSFTHEIEKPTKVVEKQRAFLVVVAAREPLEESRVLQVFRRQSPRRSGRLPAHMHMCSSSGLGAEVGTPTSTSKGSSQVLLVSTRGGTLDPKEP